MENQRLLLFFALAFVLLLIWQQWQADYGPQPGTPAAPTAQTTETPAVAGDLPTAPAAAAGATGTTGTPSGGSLAQGQRIEVHTDVYRAVIDTQGGDLRRVDLLRYPVDREHPDQPFVLLDDAPGDLFVVQSGLLSGQPAPNHHARFTAQAGSYTLAEGQDTLAVPLVWRSPEGVEVTRTYTFRRGSYVVEVSDEVRNGAAQPWTGRVYHQLQRRAPESNGQAFIYTYLGGAIYTGEKYDKIEFDEMAEADLAREISGGFAAMVQHYFVAAFIPPATDSAHYYTKSLGGDRYVLGYTSPESTAAPGGSTRYESRLFVGPKLQDELAAITPGLEYTVDYGWLTVLAQPIFFWILRPLYRLFGNWGLAIIGVTVIIKGIFYKLSETSYRSMANMRKLAPRLQALKERYGDDKQKLQQAMMEMYRTEKINPLGGCLPILVQIPVFIALYWVLLESVELRQAPFFGWLKDLSAADPYFILPIVMGVTMIAQQKLSPAPLDPVQQKVMMIMPVVFTAMFAFFPAGLVLYWTVNNVLSIAQQWMITKRVESGAKA